MIKKRLVVLLALLASVCVLVSGMAFAAEFPKEKSIRIAVTYAAGGGVDTATRILAAAAQETLGQRIDVVCLPGAGGQEAINFVLSQPHDGYTLLATDYGPLVTTALTEEVGYELDEWIPVVQITETVPTFFVKNDSPVKDMKTWVEMAKAKPESLLVAHGRYLSVPHLPLILFESKTGIKNTHVPTTGGSEALAFTLGGKTDIGASVPSTIAATVKGGETRALAVCSAQRVPTLPDTPTMLELGYDVVLPAWYSVFIPKDVPADIAKILEAKFIEALKTAAAVEMANKANVILTPLGIDEGTKSYENTIANLKTILEAAGKSK